MDDTKILELSGCLKPEISEPNFEGAALEALICYSEQNEEPYIVSWVGNDRGFFDNGLYWEDTPLLFPDNLITGLYKCTNFRAVNICYDREGGWADDWDVECNWELLYEFPKLNNEKTDE